MNIVNDLIDSIVDDQRTRPFNQGVLTVFYASSVSLIIVWMGMLWLLLGTELQSYAWFMLGLTILLIASVSWYNISLYLYINRCLFCV